MFSIKSRFNQFRQLKSLIDKELNRKLRLGVIEKYSVTELECMAVIKAVKRF